MRLPVLLVIAANALSLTAQTTPAISPFPSACGPAATTYKVQSDKDTSIPTPTSGNATLVLIEDQIEGRPGHAFGCTFCNEQLRFGMDGQWLGATAGFSHIALPVPPGDHHFCVAGGGTESSPNPLPVLLTQHIEAGQTYFLRARLSYHVEIHVWELDLVPANEDQAHYLVTITKHSLAKTP